MAVFAPITTQTGFYKFKLPGKNLEIYTLNDSFDQLTRDINANPWPLAIFDIPVYSDS